MNWHSIYERICMLLALLCLNMMRWDLFKDILIDTVAIMPIIEYYDSGYVDAIETVQKNTEISGFCGIWYVYKYSTTHDGIRIRIEVGLISIGLFKGIDTGTTILPAFFDVIDTLMLVFVVERIVLCGDVILLLCNAICNRNGHGQDCLYMSSDGLIQVIACVLFVIDSIR